VTLVVDSLGQVIGALSEPNRDLALVTVAPTSNFRLTIPVFPGGFGTLGGSLDFQYLSTDYSGDPSLYASGPPSRFALVSTAPSQGRPTGLSRRPGPA
jgi:hypothetical protein